VISERLSIVHCTVLSGPWFDSAIAVDRAAGLVYPTPYIVHSHYTGQPASRYLHRYSISKMSDDEERETKPFKFVTAGFDARFPNQNQTKHCWQNYVDYHKCILAKGEDFAPCRQFFLAYRSLCPSAWCERWDDQRENGTFPTRLDA